MNANRKADLQRKLAVAPVPKPPAGLAERIKTDIPKELRFDIDRERDRFSRSVRFSLAVAASVIVVIASAFLALRVINTTADQPLPQRPAAVTTIAPAPVAPPPAPKQEALKKVVAKKRKQQAPAAGNEMHVLDAAAKTAAVAAAPPAAANMQSIPFKELSRDEQVRILKDRLAHGADPKEIVRMARDAGLNDFAEEVEKKKP